MTNIRKHYLPSLYSTITINYTITTHLPPSVAAVVPIFISFRKNNKRFSYHQSAPAYCLYRMVSRISTSDHDAISRILSVTIILCRHLQLSSSHLYLHQQFKSTFVTSTLSITNTKTVSKPYQSTLSIIQQYPVSPSVAATTTINQHSSPAAIIIIIKY